MRTSLRLTAVFAICFSGNALCEVVGTYICAVDNCKKSYLERSVAQARACREGVGNASDTKPSSPGCLSMCDTSYTTEGERSACKTGCGMYPDACLRAGKIAPNEPGYGKTRKAWKPKDKINTRPSNSNRYRYWY